MLVFCVTSFRFVPYETTNEFDEATIYQEITTLVKNIELLKSNIVLARKTDSVAHRRFSIANGLYQVGKLSVTDLNFAQLEKDNARRTYISALRAYWDAYYMPRRVTLYDFDANKSIIEANALKYRKSTQVLSIK